MVLSNGMITANEGKLCVELVSVCDVTGSFEKLTFRWMYVVAIIEGENLK